ncbi:2528_t:CDS:2, partial [Dentiscutata erythropus]
VTGFRYFGITIKWCRHWYHAPLLLLSLQEFRRFQCYVFISSLSVSRLSFGVEFSHFGGISSLLVSSFSF